MNFYYKNTCCCDIDYFWYMKGLKQIFSFYIHGSLHVAFAVLALVLMTNHMFSLSFDLPVALFAFAGTVAGYNFIKYESFLRKRKQVSRRIKGIAFLSLICCIVTGAAFFMLQTITQITAVVFLGLTILYALPFLPNNKNMRSLSGIKIYIVALCWAGITLLLPLQNAGVQVYSDVYLKFGQRFLLVIILILIFEIIDLRQDDPQLQTVPQRIGVHNTKLVNIILLLVFYLLELFKTVIDIRQLLVNVVLVIITLLFTMYATPNRPKYYTLFWVESIPVIWLGMVVLAGKL